MSGRKKTIKTPKMVKNIENSKGSRSMFDICLYIVNKVVKQDLKMTKILAKFVEKSRTQDQRDDIDYVS